MKLDDLEDLAITMAMDHLLNVGAAGFSCERDEDGWLAWLSVSRHIDAPRRVVFASRGKTRTAARKAVVARIFAKMITRHCGAEHVALNFGQGDLFVVSRRGAK